MSKNSKKKIKNILLSLILTVNGKFLEKSNEFVKIYYDKATSRYWLYTTGGNKDIKDDDNKKLLFHNENNQTSYTTFDIDNSKYIFQGNWIDSSGPSFILSQKMWEKKLVINQIISIINGSTTGKEDTLKIEYRVRNLDSKPHKIGLRVLLDTYLGNNDGAPFSIPGFGFVTTDTSLVGSQIPDYWYVFDSISKPSVSAMCMLKLPDYIEPSEIVFSNWQRLNNAEWSINLEQGRKFTSFLAGQDSACAIYWNPSIVNPGQEQKYAVTYGIYKATIKLGDAINVALGCPERVRENMPFTVSCDIENKSGEYPLDSVEVTLELPPGVILDDSQRDSLTKTVTKLDPKGITKASWNLRLSGVNLEKAKFSVKVKGNMQNKEIKGSQKLSGEDLSVKPQTDTIKIDSPQAFIEKSFSDVKSLFYVSEKPGIKTSNMVN